MKIGLIVISTGLVIIALIASNVKTDLFFHELPKNNEITDSIIIHFIHGSIPQKNCIYQKKRLGGWLGGHIEIQIKDEIFGFLHDSIPINYFPKTNFNSKFEHKKLSDWKDSTKYDRITSICIPVSNTQKVELRTKLISYHRRTPYDYALFGQRCTSSTSKILGDVGITNNISTFEAIVSYFYPRSLRHALLKFAKINDLEIKFQKGINCHKWE